MKSIQIQLTTKCNQTCIMCRKYTWPTKEISIDKLIEVLEKYKGATVTFSGGDPLEYSNLKELNSYLKTNKVVYQVLTNLSYKLDCNMVRFVMGAKYVQVSLDGSYSTEYKEVRGSNANFNVLIENLSVFKRMGTAIKLNSTISKTNYISISNIARLASQYKCAIRFWPVHTHSDLMLDDGMKLYIQQSILSLEELNPKIYNNTNLKDWDKIINRKEEMPNKCWVKTEHRLIDEDGIEYPCCRAINDNGYDIEQEYSVNNLKEVCNPDVLYEFCKGCDRYVKFNKDWNDYKDKEVLFL